MKKTNETSTTRQLALEWWNNLFGTGEQINLCLKYFPDLLNGGEEDLSIEQIEIIYLKENIKDNQKQFVKFNSELFIKYINKFSEEDKRKAFSLMCDLLDMGEISQKELDNLQEMSWNHPG